MDESDGVTGWRWVSSSVEASTGVARSHSSRWLRTARGAGCGNALAVGAAKAILVSDPVLADRTALGTAKVLAAADPPAWARTWCSRAPSPPTATRARRCPSRGVCWNWPSVSFAKHIEISDGLLRVQRQNRSGLWRRSTCPLPAVVTVTAGVVEPRIPPSRHRGREVETRRGTDCADLGLDPSQVGLCRCPPAGDLGLKPPKHAKPARSSSDAGDAHERVIRFLEQLKIL